MVIEYNSLRIKKLEGLEGIRKRPEMYIGGTGPEGLFHCISEVIDNSIDEALSNECNNISVKVSKTGCFIQDNGRGIPSELHYKYRRPTLLLVLTKLHAGGKFDKSSEKGAYGVSGGLHGIGLKCVNAVSSKFKIRVLNKKFVVSLTFSKGVIVTRQKVLCFSSKKGTSVFFKADSSIFSIDKVQDSLIVKKVREVCFLNPGLKINFFNYVNSRYLFFLSDKGIYDYVTFLKNKDWVCLHEKPICLLLSEVIKGDWTAQLSITFFYTTNLSYKVYSYVNCIDTLEGGTHLNFFKQNIPKIINNLSYKLNSSSSNSLTSSDIRSGLFGVVLLKMFNPKFNSQTKNKLSSVEIDKKAPFTFLKKLTSVFSKNISFLKKIVEKSSRVFYLKNSLKKQVEVKNPFGVDFLYGKLADCSSSNFSKNELFIVEGDSAGGSAKQGRNRHYQAILSLKGKLINVQKSNSDKVLKNKEVSVILKALGLFSVKDEPDNNVDHMKNLKYSKVILMTDADIDGEHIKTLLLTFFYKKLKFLIDSGIVYVANPPLYKVKRGRALLSYNVNKFTFNKCVVNFFCKKKLVIYDKQFFYGFLISKLFTLFFKVHFLIVFLKKSFKSNWKPLFVLMYHKKFFLKYFIIRGGFGVLFTNAKCLTFFKKKTRKVKFSNSVGNLFFLNKTLYKLLFYKLQAGFFISTIFKKIFILEESLFFIKVSGLVALLDTVFTVSKKQFEIQRYKGLGEMNPDQLYHTSMDSNFRSVTRIYSDSLFKNNLIFENLMGTNVKVRKSFIEKYYSYLQYV